MHQVVLILQVAARDIWQLLPWVLLGVLASEGLGLLPVTGPLQRACSRNPALAIPMAAVLGMVSPLCTYGTVPLVVRLLRSGIPLAPLATFLSASSLMNPQLFLLTWGGLGAKMGTARLLSALVCGLLVGALLYAVPAKWSVPTALAEDACLAHPNRRAFRAKAFLRGCTRSLRFVGPYILLGILLGAIVQVLVPGRWILAAFGTGGWFQIFMAGVLGVPLYACGGGTIPLVQSLVAQGMAPGAALAFLVAGPATRIPPLMALATIVRPLLVVVYVVFLILYSLLAGLVYGLF